MVGGPDLSWRRFAVLLEGLPPESGFSRVVAESGEPVEEGPLDPSSWSLSQQLQGLTLDVLAAANWQRSGGKQKRPEPLMGRDRKSVSREPHFSQDEIRTILRDLSPGLPE